MELRRNKIKCKVLGHFCALLNQARHSKDNEINVWNKLLSWTPAHLNSGPSGQQSRVLPGDQANQPTQRRNHCEKKHWYGNTDVFLETLKKNIITNDSMYTVFKRSSPIIHGILNPSIQYMRPANQRQCYIVTSSVIGRSYTHKIPGMFIGLPVLNSLY